jgi:hypothetical protein
MQQAVNSVGRLGERPRPSMERFDVIQVEEHRLLVIETARAEGVDFQRFRDPDENMEVPLRADAVWIEDCSRATKNRYERRQIEVALFLNHWQQLVHLQPTLFRGEVELLLKRLSFACGKAHPLGMGSLERILVQSQSAMPLGNEFIAPRDARGLGADRVGCEEGVQIGLTVHGMAHVWRAQDRRSQGRGLPVGAAESSRRWR